MREKGKRKRDEGNCSINRSNCPLLTLAVAKKGRRKEHYFPSSLIDICSWEMKGVLHIPWGY
jgi:hypothetical protein